MRKEKRMREEERGKEGKEERGGGNERDESRVGRGRKTAHREKKTKNETAGRE